VSYSKSYQTVVAGRVREDEMPFFKNNMVAVPGRVTNFVAQGGEPSPHLKKNVLQYPGVGKPNTVSDVIDSYVDSPYNSA